VLFGMLRCPSPATAEDLSCENIPLNSSEPVLSTWQVLKKGLWDRVRGSGIEASAQEPVLMHVAWSVEKDDATVGGGRSDCPLGLLAARLLMIEVRSAKQTNADNSNTLLWLGNLLREMLFGVLWQDIVRSGWPLFALLHRFASQPFGWSLDSSQGYGESCALSGVRPQREKDTMTIMRNCIM
ncbi:unnamed protein product, partial [Polarella glacialis]